MAKLYRYICLLLLTGIFCSCGMEEVLDPIYPEVEMELPDSVFFVLADPAPMTRVTYAGDGIHADFEKEDIVGCFALNDDLTPAGGFKANACYRVAAHTDITSGEKRTFLAPLTDSDDLPLDADKYLFYYPYDSNVKSLDDLKSYSHSVATDQNSRDVYEASDLLWDICTPADGAEYVDVMMDHAMSQIIVEVDPDLIDKGTVPTLLNLPVSVSPINLLKESLDDMDASLNVEGQYMTGTSDAEREDIVMWEFGKANSGNYMFRAVVPANHTLIPGSSIVTLIHEGAQKTYKLTMNRGSISLLPGRNYYLNIIESYDYVAPEIGDDDTWVYDVLDPETGQPVGLLCREYLHFQPENSYTDEDKRTGTEYTGDRGETRYISSQAWVFYKMKSGSIPDLNTGYVLRFLSDVVWKQEGLKDALWPYPYEGYAKGGMFTPKHGHDWVANDPALGSGWDATDGDWGVDSETWVENYMHGGTIEWDGNANMITWFNLPNAYIENEVAKNNGHIAIPFNGGDPYLCYNAITDEAPHKVGILSPHSLVDRRIGKSRGVDERLYPLVKIGYNQFWMSRDLRTSTQIDGTPLVNYNIVNKEGGPGGVTILDIDEYEPGYIFLSIKCEDAQNAPPSEREYYDPYNNFPTPEERESRMITPMYNLLSLSGAGMLPVSAYGNAQYYIPEDYDVVSMLKYLGWKSIFKIITNENQLRKYTNSTVFTESKYSVYLHGKYLGTNMKLFSANICGLDMRPEGLYYHRQFQQPGERNGLIIRRAADPNGASSQGYGLFCFVGSNIWDSALNPEQVLNNNDNFIPCGSQDAECQYFAPLRFFLKFNGQADTGGISVSSMAKGVGTKAPTAPVETRDVYIGVEAVDQVQD